MIAINQKLCKGCAICSELCPKQVLALDKMNKVYVKNSENCIQCSLCELRCPDFAIEVEKDNGR